MLECICMRTTLEIRDDQRVALGAMAAKRGLRGYSELVQEAIDLYLERRVGDDMDALLSLQGSITDDEAEEIRRRIAEMWSTWRTSS